MVYSDYKYYNNLDDPENDEDFINGVKEVLKQLNITENINDIKDFVTLMKFINRLMTKHHNDLESVIADTGEPSLLVKSEIYNERHINRQSRDTAQLQKDPAKLVQKIGFPSSKKSLSSTFDRFKKEPRHYATLCYVPLPGLCTFHEDASRNRIYSILFPRGTSPFIRMFKWHTFARWYFLTYFIVVVTWFSLLIASSTVDLNKNMEIINLNNDYTDKITIAATKSYMAAVTMIGNLNDATNTFVNNMTIAEASKSNIELITKAISNVAASKIYNVNFTSEINKAAIEAVYNAIIYNTTFTAGISNSTITTINNNYVTEINKAISEIDITAINKLINSTDVVILKLSPPEAFRSLKNFFLEHGYDCISVFQTITIFISVLCIVGYLCLFRNIGLYAYIIMHICRRAICILFLLGILLLNVSYATMRIFATTIPDFDDDKKMYNKNTYDNYIKTSNNVWSGFLNASYDYMYPWDSRYFVSIMRIAFSLFASIIIMNLLIAFVNNVYEEVYKLPNNYSFSSFCFINRKNKDYFPPTIIYEANTEEFKKWHDELPNLEKQLFDSTYPI
ncbi:hypothetical protein GLOIN_2v350471 [Rhizophagus irregularis DAOM 181602=DAOM 197198]|nr:hypothetical protein GLOIN_2v350471 [Rhizophagus irregularis DAOM 181602=DAOM 197198]